MIKQVGDGERILQTLFYIYTLLEQYYGAIWITVY